METTKQNTSGRPSFDPNCTNPNDRASRPSAKFRVFDQLHLVPGGCWEWTGTVAGNGYGATYYNGKKAYIHRLMWFWMMGEWPEAVMHLCDNPACANPAHLKAGTHSDNMRDCVQKGRHVSGFTDWPDRTTERREGRKNAPRDSSGKFTK